MSRVALVCGLGSVSNITLLCARARQPNPGERGLFSEMTHPTIYEIALGEYGIKEIPGTGSNDQINLYHSYVKGGERWADNISWCSSFINYCAAMAMMERSGSGGAISWSKIGEPVGGLELCRLNDIIILHNGDESDWRGHIGLFTNIVESGYVNLLGGNQRYNRRDAVNIKPFPVDKIRTNGIRRLRHAHVHAPSEKNV